MEIEEEQFEIEYIEDEFSDGDTALNERMTASN